MAEENIGRDRNESDYREETAAELATVRGDMTLPENEGPRAIDRDHARSRDERHVREGGKATGVIAIILSVLSLFILPVLFGVAGIIVGFIARRQGANSLGNWAIGIGIVSIVISLFFAPFF
jgi:hypothetical protein